MKTMIRLEAALLCGFIVGYFLARATHSGPVFFVVWILVGIGVWVGAPKLIPALRSVDAKPIEVAEGGEWTLIKTTPAPFPVARQVVLGCFIGIVLGGIAGAATKSVVIGILVGLIVPPTLIFCGESLSDRKRCVQREPFAVRRDAIRLSNGAVVNKPEMNRIVITNPADDTYVANPFYTGTTMGTTMVAGMSALEASKLKAFGKVAFIVNLEHGGVRSPLAGGLTEPQAHAVFDEIRKRVDAFQSA